MGGIYVPRLQPDPIPTWFCIVGTLFLASIPIFYLIGVWNVLMCGLHG